MMENHRHGCRPKHTGRALPWVLVGLALIVGTVIWLRMSALLPRANDAIKIVACYAEATGARGQFCYEKVQPVLARRCYLCHGAKVQMKNIRFDSAQHVKAYAHYIYQQTVVSELMPMNNATGMTDAERLLIKQWFEARTRTD